MKKIIPILLATGVSVALFSSCGSTVSQGPVNLPAADTGGRQPSRPSEPKPEKKTTTTTGALRQVPNEPKPEKPKAYPDIPLKEDTGTSPLIITKPDTKPYVRD
ncbi:MAG: hypothetical protein KDM63_07405 [Verrucomicrobiae bacterium]|nr:hypothetical protein [Verrucomicrobiae bacterium]